MAADDAAYADPFEGWLAVLRRHPRLDADIHTVRGAVVAEIDRHFPGRFRWPAGFITTGTDRLAALAHLAYGDPDRRTTWLRAASRRERFALTVLGALLDQGASLLCARYPRLLNKSPGVTPSGLRACFAALLVDGDRARAARQLALWANAARHSSTVVEVHLREAQPRLDVVATAGDGPRTRRITPLDPIVEGLFGGDMADWDAHLGSLRAGGDAIGPVGGAEGLITIRLRGGIDPATVGQLAHRAAERLRPYLGIRPESMPGRKTGYDKHMERYLQWTFWREATEAAGGKATPAAFAVQVLDGRTGDWRDWPSDAKEIAKEAVAVGKWLDPEPVDLSAVAAPRYRGILEVLVRDATTRLRMSVGEMAFMLRTGTRPAPPTLPATLPAPDGPGPLVVRLLALLWVPLLVVANLLRPPTGPWGLTLAYNLTLLLFVGLNWNGYRPERGDDSPSALSPQLGNAADRSPGGGETGGHIHPVDRPDGQA